MEAILLQLLASAAGIALGAGLLLLYFRWERRKRAATFEYTLSHLPQIGKADLRQANLKGADLREANLANADLWLWPKT